jgi:putative hydrolase of the HAD superfamily
MAYSTIKRLLGIGDRAAFDRAAFDSLKFSYMRESYMFKAVVFDFGNVLSGLDRMAFARAAAPYSRMSPEELDQALWGGSLEHDHETGLLDSRGYFKAVGEIAGFSKDYGYGSFVEDYKKIILPNPDGEAGLIEAKKKGARCFVLSNTSWLHACTIFDNEILASIPEIHVLSYKVGYMKPGPRIWMKVLEYSGLDAKECLYIDDVPEYCAKAESLGFGVFNYDKNKHNLSQVVGNMLK